MASLQKTVERSIGDRFVDWYNQQHGACFSLFSAGETPDLHYRDGSNTLDIEVTRAYYDEADAAVVWQNARRLPNAPQSWAGINFTDDLVREINDRIAKKSAKPYPQGCILLVDVAPPLTDALDTQAEIPNIVIPPSHPFSAIYLTGNFPQSTKKAAGYHLWRLA